MSLKKLRKEPMQASMPNLLLPHELTRRSSPERLEGSPRKPPPPNEPMIFLRNYKLVTDTFLQGYSSHSKFLESQSLCKKRGQLSVSSSDKPIMDEELLKSREVVVPEFYNGLKKVLDKRNSGLFRKATRVNGEQGVVVLKSLRFKLSQLKKKSRTLYIPFSVLHKMLFLKNLSLAKALTQFISKDSSGETFLGLPKVVTADYEYRKIYSGKLRAFFLYEGGEIGQRTLWVKYYYHY